MAFRFRQRQQDTSKQASPVYAIYLWLQNELQLAAEYSRVKTAIIYSSLEDTSA